MIRQQLELLRAKRSSKRQKQLFLRRMQEAFPASVITGSQLIAGDLKTAKVILAAPYSAGGLTLPAIPKNPLLYFAACCGAVLAAAAGACLLTVAVKQLLPQPWLHIGVACFLWLAAIVLLAVCLTSRRLSPDNSAGLSVLCQLLTTLDARQQRKIAFILYDRSLSYRATDGQLLVRLDCAGQGDALLIGAGRDARSAFGQQLKRSFLPIPDTGVIFCHAEPLPYCSNRGVTVTVVKKHKALGHYAPLWKNTDPAQHDSALLKQVCQGFLALLKQL